MTVAAAIPTLLAVLAAGGSGGVAAAQERPELRAALETCTTGAAPAARVAGFVGSMPSQAGAKRMSMRFALERRDGPKGRFKRVDAGPAFGTWERSLPNRAGFVFHKRVDGLMVGGRDRHYRALVRFRWQADDGTVVRRARRRTAPCRQPDLRPDLAPGALTARPGVLPGTAVYSLTTRNVGRAAAGPFLVGVAGVVMEAGGLPAGESRVVTVVAPRCAPGSTVLLTLDPDGRIDEAREEDTTTSRPCPLGAA